MMTMRNTPEVALAAVCRAVSLLLVLDREHTPAELYGNLRGVRHELLTAQEALRDTLPTAGSDTATDQPDGLRPPSWAAARAMATRPDTHRHRVLALLVHSPLGRTDPELAEILDLPVKVARQLRWEMAEAGWVSRTQQRRENPESRRFCVVWLGTALGREVLGKLEAGQMKLPLDTPSLRGVDSVVSGTTRTGKDHSDEPGP